MKFKGTKLAEITRTEIDDIKFIASISSCTADAEDKITEMLLRDRKVNSQLPMYVVRQVAYNVYMAVMNEYKYVNIIEDKSNDAN